MKFGPVEKAVVLVVLACLALGAIWFLDRIPAHRLLSFIGMSGESAQGTPVPSAQPEHTESLLSGPTAAWSRSTVAVQSFLGSSLVASGAGTAVSSDGLILTTSWVAPYGSGSYVYQVATAEGAVLRAKGVWRASGLVLLKVDAAQLEAVLFDDSVALRTGQQLVLVGAFLRLSQYVPVIISAEVPYVADSRQAVLSFDRTLISSLIGSRVVDAEGRSVGLFWPTNPARILPASDVNDVLERYLATTHQ